MKKALFGMVLLFSITAFTGCTSNESKAAHSSTEATSQVAQVRSTKESSSKSTSTQATSVSTSQTTSSTVSSQTEESTSVSEEVSTAGTWNATKSGELQGFISTWEQAMGQSYKEYAPGNNVNFYGLQLPDGVIGGSEMPLSVNNQPVTAEWSLDGTSSAEYSVVAVYSDAENSGRMNNHVYFFAFHNQQPVVLVSMQNQGMEDHAFHLQETGNQELKNGFAAIVNE
ncbi:DUF4767 domain-containing protein [Enterococcus devriesei]|uniref:DUF4767 domain-containing protein n=1 Tax=Enterococcus devriesei TaxID=319970 RepID=A0A1L8STX5_9ENTE|nr:DUF4767 domain-containing protein [Enterococcus devriesei]OJG35426.1 hypothetical protein RV00_GL002611 [Enterococcus devriesei]